MSDQELSTLMSEIAVIKNELKHIKKDMLTKNNLLGVYIKLTLWSGSTVFGAFLIGFVGYILTKKLGI